MMEEEVGIKVTRLRRRLSVESDDVKSPSTQSTPTKKRGGRLAAKPQLELIDENAPEAAPKRTRKSTARDIAEPVEDKAVTPSRRSTRIRSNTSILSETDVAEDKGTPSRRSTRIKSNTSIIAESVQNVNSPRAKRAARRTSQVGSDNETPVTPVRSTRRTRKDSTSSIDKQADTNAGKTGSQTNEVIVEESETNVKVNKSSDSPISASPTPRKSPRLVGKNGRKSTSLDNDNKENEPQSEKALSETPTDANKSAAETKAEQINEIDEITSAPNNLSVTSSNLIKELEEAPKKGKSIMNKSTTAVEEPQIKNKRNRTKSWTTISVEPSHENSFCSDSEASKKKSKKKNNTLNFSNISGSGDGIMNIHNKDDGENNNQEKIEVSLNSSSLSEKKKKKRQERSIRGETEMSLNETSVDNKSDNLNKSNDKISDPKEDSTNNKGVTDSNTFSNKHNPNDAAELFEQAPSSLIQSVVFIEDSDSSQGITQKANIDECFDSGDQCVPVVDHRLREDDSSKVKSNLSYEPMDIDETMPENISLTTFAEKNISMRHEDQETGSEKRQSINNSYVKNNSIHESKRKSSISNMVTDDNIHESNKSQTNMSSANMSSDDIALTKDSNKSKRKSSISTNSVTEDTTDGTCISDRKSISLHNDNTNKKSKRKSSVSNIVTENNVNENSNESFKNSSSINNIANNEDTNVVPINDNNNSKISNKSKRKSLMEDTGAEENTEISVKSKRKSSIMDNVTEENKEKSLNKSKRKSSVSFVVGEEILPISNIENEVSMEKSTNKSQSRSKISQTLDKTDNDSKSTLVLSQLKDVSETDINMNNPPKDTTESDEQLSKSISVSNVITEKECDKKNISLTYKTSTPLQQKSIKKLGMHINSSIIAPNSARKVEQKNTSNHSKKEASIMSQKSDSSDSSENEEDSSFERSKMIDDEAEEASDDYESGDSRDESEKEYEEQNEIVEKGETLDTEDENEYSDDSEYEKGSFIVSSDAEDDDLLSGSGDDLSLSANELSMSAKSKKKYNERKLKEQKKASREMFEARHKNDSEKSSKSTKSKSKNNRQRFDSSSSDSNEEVTTQSKKNRRQRIDSSEDISIVQPDKSLSRKKKKVKRLSESVCEDDPINETEITIRNDPETGKLDPLTLQNLVKKEPKTPQKDFNISTVAITNMDEVEEVNVDENVSMIKYNKTLASDPLQATVVEDDAEDIDDDDSISENEEIAQNYESVLNNLNVSNSKKIKSSDMSLNPEKKSKQKPKEPIVEQLNLTQIKNTKKTVTNKKLDKSMNKKDKVDTQENMFSESSSDSIDMKLLFPEESNDSEVLVEDSNSKKQKANESIPNEDIQHTTDNFIPLKRTEGKTNMLEKTDYTPNSKDESILNVSNKKKNKRKSSHTDKDIMIGTQDDDVGFFIDTTGTLCNGEESDVNTSIKSSIKKTQKNNASFLNIEKDEDSNDAPLEVSYHSEKNKSKQNPIITENKVETEESGPTTETPSQSSKKKKNNKKSLNSSQNVAEISMIENIDDVTEKSINISVTKESAKKKKQSISQIEQEKENTEHTETVENISLNSAKKQKQKATSESSVPEEENTNKNNKDDINEEVISKKRKRKSSANQSIIEEIIDKDNIEQNTSKSLDKSLLTNNQKKKRKFSNNDSDTASRVKESVTVLLQETQEYENTPATVSINNDKVPQLQEVDAVVEGTRKKSKKRKIRDDDEACKMSKVLKQDSFDKVHVPRLPVDVISQLGDKKQMLGIKKPKVISTTLFDVKETKTRGKNPSSYLEESVYLNDDSVEKKKKGSIKYPKTLPSVPSALTSASGFTTKFKVNPISQQTQFTAQSSDMPNFKNDYLNNKRIKKLGTFELYKRQRNIKISKF